jgi:homoserine/homoserine lactone efflux protein
MSFKVFLFYFVTWSLVALTPGPAVMCAMSQATRYGFRSSLAGIAGTQLGNISFFVCTALGLVTLLKTASAAFTILRIVGAAYLFYLGLRIIFSTLGTSPRRKEMTVSAFPSLRSLVLQGLLIQLTNPKALLFVSALLPQFIDPNASLIPQIAILVLTTVVIDFSVLSTYAFFAERGAQSWRGSRLCAWLERVLGGALVFFGFRLLLSRK